MRAVMFWFGYFVGRVMLWFKLGLLVPLGAAVYEVTVAAATAILGYDLFRDEPWSVSDEDRVITGMAVTGSAAAGDAAVDLLVGQTRVMRKYNTVTGFPTMDHVQPLDVFVPAGAKVSAPVVDAPATNALNVMIIIQEVS